MMLLASCAQTPVQYRETEVYLPQEFVTEPRKVYLEGDTVGAVVKYCIDLKGQNVELKSSLKGIKKYIEERNARIRNQNS